MIAYRATEPNAQREKMNTTATARKYYVIETNYVDDESGDRVEIRTTPARTNFSHEVRIIGFCGATNNKAVYAHGEFATLDAARAAIASLFDVNDDDDEEEDSDDEELVEKYFLRGEDDDGEDDAGEGATGA